MLRTVLPLSTLVKAIKPGRTALLFGAGASVPSGAPTGAQLATTLWKQLVGTPEISTDLAEVCSMIERKVDRQSLVRVIRSILKPLTPTGGLLAIPELGWHTIYTTNFDQLLEAAYQEAGRKYAVVRSNYDLNQTEAPEMVHIFKIHGCISQDLVDGHKGRMVLTHRDYREYEAYRQVVFRRLNLDLATKDVLIVGHSLADPHLRRDMQVAMDLQQGAGAPGRIYVVVYQSDVDRADLLEDEGFSVTFGGLDELIHEMVAHGGTTPGAQAELPLGFSLPPLLRTSTIDVAHASRLPGNVLRLFNGAAASYGDITESLTIERSGESKIMDALAGNSSPFVTLVGVAGVGKTTLARRILHRFHTQGFLAWEHRADFPLHQAEWLGVERQLREGGLSGVLLIDECPAHMREVNRLVDGLARNGTPALRLALTANASQWIPRVKSPLLFSLGLVERVSVLTEGDIDRLVRLIDTAAIRALVEPEFARLRRPDQIRHLRNRCSADMYVCLKNIFATDQLDTILLREYAGLSEDMQDIYRHVAALESSGTRVHRQLVVRLLGIRADKIGALLNLLEGLVEEYDIQPDEGIYGWQTRHLVIAQTIAKYKFFDEEELFALFDRVIGNLNPTLHIEQRTIRDLCQFDFGIPALTDPERQVDLYTKLIALAPKERIPRHRLISRLLHLGRVEAASQAIRSAEDNVGVDSPINRFKAQLHVFRAQATEGILLKDRMAMLNEAYRVSYQGIQKFTYDKYAYMVFGDVAVAIAELCNETGYLQDGLIAMREAAERLLDPQLNEALNRLEREAARFNVRPPWGKSSARPE